MVWITKEARVCQQPLPKPEDVAGANETVSIERKLHPSVKSVSHEEIPQDDCNTVIVEL
jgi:hypothetical protein